MNLRTLLAAALLASAALAAPAAAQAQTSPVYELIVADSNGVVLIERTSIASCGANCRRAWTAYIFPVADHGMLDALTEYDCTGRRMRTVTSSLFDADTRHVSSTHTPGPWEYVRPDSIGDRARAAACSPSPLSRTSARRLNEIQSTYRQQQSEGHWQ